jgi:hypothetical protein
VARAIEQRDDIDAAIPTKDVSGTATTDDITATVIDQLDPSPSGYADGDP